MDSINNVSQGYSSIQSTNECSNIGSKILPNLFNYDGNEFLCDFKAPNRPQCSDELSSGPTAPPPSCCSTSSDQSTNAFPSPGPMKRFRQIYGDQTGQSSICQLHDSKKAAMNWTENWMNAHHHCSEPSTSNSPSIISNGSVVSKLSTVSVDTQLSVAVDLLNLEPNFFQVFILNYHRDSFYSYKILIRCNQILLLKMFLPVISNRCNIVYLKYWRN